MSQNSMRVKTLNPPPPPSPRLRANMPGPNDKGRDHSRPLRFSAWRRYQVRRDMPSLSQGFLASMVLARSSIRGRPVLRRFIAGAPFLAGAETRDAGDSIFARDWNS